MKTLHLTLNKMWFDIMVTGQKAIEIRKDSPWIRSRLENKEYDIIRFTNGYGNDKPFFEVKYLGYKRQEAVNAYYNFGTNFKYLIETDPGDYIIQLGKISRIKTNDYLVELMDEDKYMIYQYVNGDTKWRAFVRTPKRAVEVIKMFKKYDNNENVNK